jgi:deoxyribonuclease I
MAIRNNYEEMLREWYLFDQPDECERDRNSLIEDVQGNRNPFYDYTELVERVRDY